MADQFGLTQSTQNLQQELDQANPTTLADCLRLIKLGTMATPLKVTFVGLTSSATQNITTAAAFAAATVNQGPAGLTTLPPILDVSTLRDAHSNILVDSGGAAVASTATYPGTVILSDDGTTLTFAAAVTGFTIEYQPRPSASMTARFDNMNREV